MEDMSEPEHCLGLEIKRDKVKQEMTINQLEYTKKILEGAGMSNCKPKNISDAISINSNP